MSDKSVVSLGEICPHLGVAGDPAVRSVGASALHRCHGDSKPRLIGVSYQSDFCLSGDYEACPRWFPAERETSVVEGVGYLFGWNGRALRRATSEAARHLATGLMALAWMALAVTAIVLLTPMLTAANPSARAGALPPREISTSDRRPQAAAVEEPQSQPTQLSQAPAEAGAADATSQVASSAEAAPATTMADEPAPSPEATAAPVVQAPPVTPEAHDKAYVVQSKDTLWSLAKAHGVTVDEIMAANGLGNRDYIRSGQTLVIPQPARQP